MVQPAVYMRLTHFTLEHTGISSRERGFSGRKSRMEAPSALHSISETS